MCVLSHFSHIWLCNPLDCSPPDFSVHRFPRQEYWSGLLCPLPGDLPNAGMEPAFLMSTVLAGRFFTTSTTWEAYRSITQKVKLSSSVCPDSLLPPQTVAHHAPLSMEFSVQEYRSGLSFPSPGDLSDSGVEPVSPALQADSLPLSHQGSPGGVLYELPNWVIL